MDDIPYRAPLSEGAAVGVLSGRQEGVRSVALLQKGLIVCILLYPLVIGSPLFTPPGWKLFIFFWGIVLVGVAGLVLVFRLALEVYGVGLGLLLGLSTALPFVGLLTLLVINGKATRVLRQNGYRVGLLGAKI